jgi:RNA-directed DNA polymerase
VRHRTPRKRGDSLERIIVDLNPTLRGWYGYFKHAHRWTFPAVDGFVRRRLRAILRKQMKQGQCYADHRRWPNAFFARHGLFTLTTAHDSASQSRC